MLIEQIIEFKFRGSRPPGRTCPSTTGYFYDETKNLRGKSSTGFLFTVKILHETMYLTFPYLGQITY